jgi:hypothetical protein
MDVFPSKETKIAKSIELPVVLLRYIRCPNNFLNNTKE